MNTAKIELHLHLDGSLNIRWAYDKALERHIIPQNETFEEFYNCAFALNTEHSEVSITKFDLMCDLLQTREDLFDATYDLCRRLFELGIIYAEIRFASQQHCKLSLDQYEALKAVIDGASKAMNDYPIKVGIINCMMHKGDSASVNYNENLDTIRVSEMLYCKGLVGIDLAGYENNCDFNEYAPLFEIVRNKHIPYTIHAGEMGIGAHIIDALNMKPNRIGHGINCIQDERYVQALLDSNTPLEVCVTGNIKNTMNYGSHPIRYMLERGLNITINSDNMMFARTDLVNEHNQLRMLGISDETLMKCTRNAIEVSFADEDTKNYLRNIIG